VYETAVSDTSGSQRKHGTPGDARTDDKMTKIFDGDWEVTVALQKQ